jgi:hypothetical protein
MSRFARLVTCCATIALVAGSGASAGTARVAPLRATLTYSTQFLEFGDAVTARLTVLADRSQVNPATLRLSTNLGKWTDVRPPQIISGSDGTTYVRTWSFTVACLDAQCLGVHQPIVMRLPPVSLTVTRLDGVPFTLTRAWPKLSITPRFGPPPTGGVPDFEIDHQSPGLFFRVSPARLGLALDIAAGLLAACGFWLVGYDLLRRRSPRSVEIQPLARALAFVRQAKSRSVDDRRTAVGLLARTLEHDGGSLSAAASRVAWSAGEPSPGRLDELVRMVEGDGEGPS